MFRDLEYLEIAMVKSMLASKDFQTAGKWLADNTAGSQSEAMSENPGLPWRQISAPQRHGLHHAIVPQKLWGTSRRKSDICSSVV